MLPASCCMNARLAQKAQQIEEFVNDLISIKSASLEEYSKDKKTKAACERYLERIIESLVDLAHIKIRVMGLRTPEDDKETFDILASAGIITRELAVSLKEAKGMRNILAHQYGDIDDTIIFESIDGDIETDAMEFVSAVLK